MRDPRGAGGRSPHSFTALLDQARRAMAAGAPDVARETAANCARMAQEAGDHVTQAMACRVQGQALRATGRHAEAIDALRAAANAARAAGNDLLAAQVRLGEIDSLGMLGRADEAVALGAELERTLSAHGAGADAAKALCNVGSVHLRRDKYGPAIDCYRRAETIFAYIGDPLMRATTQVNQAIALTYQNDVEAAIALYDTAATIYSADAEQVTEAAAVDTNVGFLHHISGRHAMALAYLNRAHDVFAARGRAHDAARCDIDRGDCYRVLNLFPEALDSYSRALVSFDALPLDYDRARAEMGRASVLFSRNRTDDGLTALENSDAIFRRQRNTPQRAHVRLTRAAALYAARRPAEAGPLARAAARVFSRHDLPGWAAEARYLYALIGLEASERTAAAVAAARTMTRIVGIARQERRGWLECRAEHALGRYYASVGGNRSRGLEHLRRSVMALEATRTRIAPEDMHTAFLRDKLTVYEDLVALLLARGSAEDIEEALGHVERSRSRLLLDRIAASAEQTPLTGTTAARLARLRGDLSRAYRRQAAPTHGEDDDPRRFASGSPHTPVLDQTQIAETERAYAAALREIELADSLPAGGGELVPRDAVPLDALRAALAPKETLVSFYAVNGDLAAFVLRRNEPTEVRVVARLDEVSQTTRRLRYHLQKMQMAPPLMRPLLPALGREIEGVLDQLYDLLLRPLEPSLNAAERVVFVPYGSLHGLPFHAFRDKGRYVLDRWEISYAPSATVWHGVRTAVREEQTTRGEPLIIGVAAPGIERVALEIERIARILPNANVLSGNAATHEAVTNAMPDATVLHLAAHARFREDNPLFGGVRLSDGWLLARDMYDMRLRHCELVTISACETAVSRVEPGDELFGLVRGFLAAGARTVVGSFWPADDEATADLMTAFYAARREGLSDGAALRRAQQEARRVYPHPYHWAAFGLIGHGGNVAENGGAAECANGVLISGEKIGKSV